MKLKSFVATGTVGLLAIIGAALGVLFDGRCADLLGRLGHRRGCTCRALDYCCIRFRAGDVVLWDA